VGRAEIKELLLVTPEILDEAAVRTADDPKIGTMALDIGDDMGMGMMRTALRRIRTGGICEDWSKAGHHTATIVLDRAVMRNLQTANGGTMP